MVYKSDFTILRNMEKRNFLFNTLYGTLDEVDFKRLDDIKKTDDLSEKYLLDRGHLQKVPNSQYKEYCKLCEEYKKIRKRPIQFFVPLTMDCNLSCTYCFQKGRVAPDLKNESLIKIYEAIKVIKARYGADMEYEIILYGGEPLLLKNRDIINQIIRICRGINGRLRIITNGINIAQFIKKLCDIRDLISTIVITIDGDKKQHNKTRIFQDGSGTYDKIAESIELLKAENLPFKIRINATASLIDNILDERLNLDYENYILYRVNYAEYKKNVCFGKIYKLICENKLKVEQVGINPVRYFYYLVNDYNSYPLYRYCDNEFIYLFSLDGKRIYHCNEAESENLLAGIFAPSCQLAAESQLEKVYISNRCKRCEMLPLCGGGCSLQRENTETCPFYSDIMGMIDEYIGNIVAT